MSLSFGRPRHLPGGGLFSIIDKLGGLEALISTTKLVLRSLRMVDVGRLRCVASKLLVPGIAQIYRNRAFPCLGD